MYFITGIISFLYIFYIYLLLKKYLIKDRDIINPGLLFPLIIIIYYQFRLVVIQLASVLKIEDIKSEELNPLVYQDKYILLISFFIFFSLCIFSIFSLTFSKIKIPKIKFKNIKSGFYLSFIIFLISFGVRIIKVNLGYQSYGGESIDEEAQSVLNYLLTSIGIFFSLSYLHIIICFLIQKDNNYLKSLIFISTIIISIYYNFFLGGGIDGYILLITPFIIVFHYYYFKKLINISINQLFLFFSFLIIFLIFSFLMKEFSRNIVMSNVLQTDRTFLEIVKYSFLSLVNRFHGADSMLTIIYKHDYLGFFKNFSTYKLILIGLIPRFLWSEKSEITLGPYFTNYYWFDGSVDNNFQTTAFLLPGEFYMNFGFIGVIFGFMFMGIFLSIIYKSMHNNLNIFNLVFLGFLIPNLIRHEYSFASYVLGMIKISLIFYLFYILHRFSIYFFYQSLK